MPTLYHYPWAPYARKALVAAYEVEAVCEEVIVPAFDEGAMQRLRAETSPFTTIPLLLLGPGRYIGESSLIVEYFDLHAAEPGRLVPKEAMAALEVRAHDRFSENILAMTHFLTWALRKPPAELNHKRIEETRRRLASYFTVLDERLAGKDFLHDDRFTMADLGSACAVSVLLVDRSLDLSEIERYPNVAAWYARIGERPSWKRMLACAERLGRPPQLA